MRLYHSDGATERGVEYRSPELSGDRIGRVDPGVEAGGLLAAIPTALDHDGVKVPAGREVAPIALHGDGSQGAEIGAVQHEVIGRSGLQATVEAGVHRGRGRAAVAAQRERNARIGPRKAPVGGDDGEP